MGFAKVENSPEPGDDAFCLELNFNISKVGYYKTLFLRNDYGGLVYLKSRKRAFKNTKIKLTDFYSLNLSTSGTSFGSYKIVNLQGVGRGGGVGGGRGKSLEDVIDFAGQFMRTSCSTSNAFSTTERLKSSTCVRFFL